MSEYKPDPIFEQPMTLVPGSKLQLVDSDGTILYETDGSESELAKQPDLKPRDTLPPVEIFDLVPAMAVELRSGGDTSWVIYWRVSEWLECSAPTHAMRAFRWNGWAEWAREHSVSIPCVPCERGDIFARVPWPEGM